MGCSQGQACFGKVQEAEWYQKLRHSVSGSVLNIFRAAKDHSETNQDTRLSEVPAHMRAGRHARPVSLPFSQGRITYFQF